MRDAFPTGFTYTSSSTGSVTSGVWLLTLPSLAVGASGSVTITGTVYGLSGALITNVAMISGLDDPITENNIGTGVTVIVSTVEPIDLSLGKTVSLITGMASDTLIYTLSYANLSTVTVSDVRVHDLLPSLFTFVSSDPAEDSTTVAPDYLRNV